MPWPGQGRRETPDGASERFLDTGRRRPPPLLCEDAVRQRCNRSGFARSGDPGNSCWDRGGLGFQYLRNGGPALCFLPGGPHITPRYARLVRRWLFYPDCLRASSINNAWLGVSNTAANEGCRRVPQQTEYRLRSRWFSLRALHSRQLLNNAPFGNYVAP